MNTTPHVHPSSPSKNDYWFSVSVGLMGIIVGYAMASVINPSAAGADVRAAQPAEQVAQIPAPPAPTNPAKVDDDPMLGEKNAPITLIEFTDYQCPFCDRFFTQTLPQIKQNYIETGKVKFVVRDFPLSIHPNAQKAAEASECADEQGKFWEMHDMLFGKQAEWSNADGPTAFTQYAADLGLNTKQFADCLDTDKYAAETQKDMSDGSAAGITGTPGFWVIGKDGKGQLLSGAQPYASFQAAIDKML